MPRCCRWKRIRAAGPRFMATAGGGTGTGVAGPRFMATAGGGTGTGVAGPRFMATAGGGTGTGTAGPRFMATAGGRIVCPCAQINSPPPVSKSSAPGPRYHRPHSKSVDSVCAGYPQSIWSKRTRRFVKDDLGDSASRYKAYTRICRFDQVVASLGLVYDPDTDLWYKGWN